MGANWGKNLRLTIFGESHGGGVGIVVDGLPAGTPVDEDAIAFDMSRRAPGGALATSRKEADAVEIVSGVYRGRATGGPICCLIRNTNTRSGDYDEISRIARPSHADYTGKLRYGGYNDPRGGGHFSGRLTAPLVCAGALCRGWLGSVGVRVGAHLLAVGPVRDDVFDPCGGASQLDGLDRAALPLLNVLLRPRMEQVIQAAREDGDSVGGVIECAAFGVPAGWGDPFFDSVESTAASLLFSVPGVKGVEFGAGFALAEMAGSAANDAFVDGGATKTNHSGGINGGITNGMPIVVRAALRPTPSIAKEQCGLEIQEKTAQRLSIQGRHDPCIAVRAVPVIESALLLALADRALEVVSS